jgi:pimeloyl-ACP methyl ester carboxylesterase
MIAVAATVATGWEGQARSAAGQAPRDSLVAVGSYRLHFRIFDGSGPVVLLESAGGADATQWDSLAPRIATGTGATVVAYDRAGFGASDLPAEPYDIRQEVAGLWRGLEHLGLTDSLVLVGHSYGGFLIQLTAQEHPRAVRALVYVDPNSASFVEAVGGADAVLRILDQGRRNSAPPGQELTKQQRANARVIANFAATVAIMREVPVLATVPVRVITAGRPWWPTPAASQAFREAHERLAGSVPDGQLIVAERSAHMIPRDQPELIIKAVRAVARQGREP